MSERSVASSPRQLETSGAWLTQRIKSQKLLKKDVCAKAGIKYKTLRNYLDETTVPTLTAEQWWGFAEALQIDLKILMGKFINKTSD